MAFINERISDKDIEKYNLMDIWKKYKADKTIKVLDSDKPYDFAIDREKGQWLIYLARVKHELWEPKRQGYTKEHIFIFCYDHKPYEVRLVNNRYNITEVDGVTKYEITWSLKSISPEPKDRDAFIASLKEALKTYGERGLSSEEDINIIECNF